jgi:hypothetical protein
MSRMRTIRIACSRFTNECARSEADVTVTAHVVYQGLAQLK